MPHEKAVVERYSLKSFLEELATYVSLLSPLIGAPIAWQGLQQTNYVFLFSSVLPLFMGVVWLLWQYRRAKNRMLKEGVVQRPVWLWRFITNKVPNKSEQLVESQVMVLVPPAKHTYALRLDEEYNNDGYHILLFHYITEPVDGVINEDQGQINYGGEPRSLETLAEEMDECAALVLLDDTKWDKYERTMGVVEAWSKRHTVRPVMSVHLNGRGTLNYSWNRFEDLVKPNRSLKNRLLAQAANRGAEWFWQARLYRRIILWTLGLTLPFSLLVFFSSYRWQRKAREAEATALTQVGELKDDIKTFEKLLYSVPSAQQEISRAFEKFRSDSQTPEAERLQRLLQVHAHQIRITLAGASADAEAISGNVIMFSVENIGERQWRIREVAATRIPPNNKPFTVKLEDKGQVSNIAGMVSCALVSRAFILWTGEWEGKHIRTTKIEAWNLEGNPVGNYDKEKILIDDHRCEYEKREKEDLHRRMLCGPVGLDLNSNDISPAGAICVEYTENVKFLDEKWVRQTIARYGASLSFEFWDKALPKEHTRGGPDVVRMR